MQITVIGIDCATNPANVGLALATFSSEHTAMEQVQLGSRSITPADLVAQWVQQRGTPALLALDAPLGWPAPLMDALSNHRAGAELNAEAHALFRRTTDRFIKQHIGKQPLDIGADRIARTAHAALALLGELRRRLKEPIPLAWHPHIQGVAAIEVYPAATLAAHGISARGYKHVQGIADRERIMSALGTRMRLPPGSPALAENPHVVDAAGCVLAAQDFLLGLALSPPEQAPVEREGWIWVRQPGA